MCPASSRRLPEEESSDAFFFQQTDMDQDTERSVPVPSLCSASVPACRALNAVLCSPQGRGEEDDGAAVCV